MNVVWWSPCSITVCVCRVLSDVGSASPCRHLNFSPRSVHRECLHLLLCSLSLFLSISLSLILLFSHFLLSHHTNLPLLTHVHTHTSNQSKDLSRLALEKTPWRHLLILTIFRYSFSSPSFFFAHSFEFLTSPLNKRCSHPRGERKVGGRVSNEGKEKAGEPEGKRFSPYMLSHLSPKTSTLYA